MLQRFSAHLLSLALLVGCQASDVRTFWTTHEIDYSDIQAAENQFADFCERAAAAPEHEALDALDILFDRLKEDPVAYYIYCGWMDGAFYSPLSPCRNAALYAKAADRILSDGVLSEDECVPFRQRQEWIGYNLKGTRATVPGCDPVCGQRTLVLVLNLDCPSCREALASLSARREFQNCRHLAVGFGFGEAPDVPGWDYLFPAEATLVFDPNVSPVYFVIAEDGTVEIPYTTAYSSIEP